MPMRAIKSAPVDHVVPIAEMGELLVRLVREEPQPAGEIPSDILSEVQLTFKATGLTAGKENEMEQTSELGNPAAVSCPTAPWRRPSGRGCERWRNTPSCFPT